MNFKAILEIKINSGFQRTMKRKVQRQRLAKISKISAGTRCQMIDSISGLKCDSHQIQYAHLGICIITLWKEQLLFEIWYN